MEAVILRKQEIEPHIWDSFVAASPQGMIYSCYHYISALESDWQAVIIRNNDRIHAVMPLTIKSKGGIPYSTQPIFTQYWGIMFRPVETNSAAKAFEQKRQWVRLILNTLPDIKLFDYNFSPTFDYPLPFSWEGYSLNTRYSNQVDLSKPTEELWSNISEKTRSHIRKTERDELSVNVGQEIAEVIKIFRRAKDEKIKNMTDLHYKALAEIAHHYMDKGMCYTIIARDKDGSPIAGTLHFKYKGTTIYALGTNDPEYKGTSALSLVIWKAIQRAKEDCAVFDFEGSMIEPIEHFFLSFGAIPRPYLNIRKEQLPLWVKVARKLRAR